MSVVAVLVELAASAKPTQTQQIKGTTKNFKKDRVM
jgi:hypothetical protein